MLNTADDTLSLIRELLASQRLAVLSTQDHGQPYCNIIAIAATDDLKNLLLATTRATRKYASLMADPRVAVLSTQDHGQPYCNIIAIAATDDLKNLLLATTRATRKYASLMADPRVAVLVDNRKNDPSDFAEAAAVTALGKAWELQGSERQRFLKVYLARHPYLEEFVAAPTCALLRIKVEKYITVSRFQDVREIRMPA